jgi:MFS family permease
VEGRVQSAAIGAGESGESGETPGRDRNGRPTAILPTSRLFLLAIYWFGISSIFSGLGAILASRLEFERLVAAGTEGAALLQITALGSMLAVVVQPTIGAISDFSSSRWGRRRPYIVVGACLDIVFLTAIAMSNTVLAIAAFYILLQVSSNVAQGPYQGYVPDMVPGRQVGMASALVGLMQIMGNVLGYGVGAVGIATGQYAIATVALGALEFGTMVVMIAGVREPATRRDRGSRSWLAVARSAWGLDVFAERSFVWLVASRLFVLMASGVLINLVIFYLSRCFRLAEAAAGGTMLVMVATVAVANALAVIPAARLSDRIGRKRVIYLSCAFGFVGLGVVAGAPGLEVAVAGVALFGVATGMFLAVDWALLTELVPKISSGRYMGISNVATASAGVLAIGIAGTLMDFIGGPARDAAGPRAAMLLGATWFLVGAALLRQVHEPSRDPSREPGR